MVDIDTKINELVLMHHGIKGMKWGVRRKDMPASNVVVSLKPRSKKVAVKTTGGERHSPHPDAINAKVSAQKAKKSGLHALSNEELQSLARRLNLEKQVSDLAGDQLASKGEQAVRFLIDINTPGGGKKN